MIHKLLPLLLLCWGGLSGQEVRVYSEFVRVDPFGQLVGRQIDQYREILSPGIGRGGFASFRVVVEPGDIKASYKLDVGLNPEDAVRITMYRETFVEQDGKWMPGKLEKISLPFTVAANELRPVPAQTVDVYWMDVFAPAYLKPDRIKVQPEIFYQDQWFDYPMEVRVLDKQFPALPEVGKQAAEMKSDGAWQTICSHLGSMILEGQPPEPMSAEWLLRRNIYQDAKLWRAQPNSIKTAILQKFGVKSGPEACFKIREFSDQEQYFQFRDLLLESLGK
jgi:hypothetical protein